MGKSLYEFSKDKRNFQETKVKTPDISDSLKNSKSKVEGLEEEALKKKIKDYSKLSQNDLMNELQREVGKQKANGSFDANSLSQQLRNVKHMLNDKQSANLEKILKNLK